MESLLSVCVFLSVCIAEKFSILIVIINLSYIGEDDPEGRPITFDNADPYLAEDKAFLAAVTSGDPTHILSSYRDAAKTYELSWAIRSASSSTST